MVSSYAYLWSILFSRLSHQRKTKSLASLECFDSWELSGHWGISKNSEFLLLLKRLRSGVLFQMFFETHYHSTLHLNIIYIYIDRKNCQNMEVSLLILVARRVIELSHSQCFVIQGDQPSARIEACCADSSLLSETNRKHCSNLLHFLHYLRNPRSSGSCSPFAPHSNSHCFFWISTLFNIAKFYLNSPFPQLNWISSNLKLDYG